jgi:ceramide glucosyltransferase
MATAATLALTAGRVLATALAALGILYALFAIVAVRRFARAPVPESAASLPPVTVLKPLHGAEPGLALNLASFARQDYPAPVQLVCGVQDEGDPAIGVVEGLVAPVQLDLVIDSRLHGPNRKVGNLINMTRAARHPVLVLADSDMRVPPDYLRRVVAPLTDPRVGLVTCLYRGISGGGPWSALAAAGVSYHFLPSVLVGHLVGATPGCFGSTMALRRETLERLGGFEAFAHHLADDYALGAAVRDLGLGLVLSPLLIDHVSDEPSAAAMWAHDLRWARTVRLLSPWGHAGTVVTHALPMALLALALGAPGAPWLLLAAAVARLALAAAIDVMLEVRPRRWPLVLARDPLSFAIFVTSFLGRGVVWRGRRYRVSGTGLMTEQQGISR